MIGRALARGVKDAARRPGLVALLWTWNLVLAAAVTLPFWAWIARASGGSPVTDVLLDGADVGVITSLIVNDPAAVMTLFAGVAALAFLAILSGAFLSGGILEVLTTEGDGRPLAHRFFRGAGHFFGRFFRLLVFAALTALPAIGLTGAALGAATKPLSSGGSEPAAFWGWVAVQAGIALAIGWLILALDYARAATVISGTRSMFRTWLRSLVFVIRHLPATATMGVLAAVGVAGGLAVSAAYDLNVSGRAWAAILGTMLIHQAMMFVRTAIRVGQVSAQADYWRAVQTAVAPVAAAAEPARTDALLNTPLVQTPLEESLLQASPLEEAPVAERPVQERSREVEQG